MQLHNVTKGPLFAKAVIDLSRTATFAKVLRDFISDADQPILNCVAVALAYSSPMELQVLIRELESLRTPGIASASGRYSSEQMLFGEDAFVEFFKLVGCGHIEEPSQFSYHFLCALYHNSTFLPKRLQLDIHPSSSSFRAPTLRAVFADMSKDGLSDPDSVIRLAVDKLNSSDIRKLSWEIQQWFDPNNSVTPSVREWKISIDTLRLLFSETGYGRVVDPHDTVGKIYESSQRAISETACYRSVESTLADKFFTI